MLTLFAVMRMPVEVLTAVYERYGGVYSVEVISTGSKPAAPEYS